MCWQRSRTCSWHAAGCYAVRDWGNSVSAEGEICLRKAGLCLHKDEIRPIQSQKRYELFISSKLQLWGLFRASLPRGSLSAEVKAILRAVSHKLALLIAKNPRALDELEWRDIERTIAEVFDGLGFLTTLTPPSKDGGKDVVLECTVKGQRAEYLVEIKHWRAGNRVGGGALRSFLNVIAKELRQGGLFLSTYGYCDNAFEQLSTIDREKLRFGTEEKVVALCRTYEKALSGLWSPPKNLAEVLYEGTT